MTIKIKTWGRIGLVGIAGFLLLLCVVSGSVTADVNGTNYVSSSTITAGGNAYAGSLNDELFNISTVQDGLNTQVSSTSALVYATTSFDGTGLSDSKDGMKLSFTVPKNALYRTGTRGAFVYPNSSGYGTENGIRVAPDGEFGILDRVALSYDEIDQTVSATLSLPPRTDFTPKLMYENPLGSVGVDFPKVQGMASGEASNVVSNTTIYGADGNATGYYDDDLVNNGTYLMDVITAHVENNTAAPVYLSVANSSLENLTSEGKNKITLYDVRGAAIRNASAFQLNGTMSGINVTGFDGSEVVVPLENVTRDTVSMQFNVSTEDVEHPRVVDLMADTLATETVVVDASVVPAVNNMTVNPSEVAAGAGTEEVTLTANLGGLPMGYTELEYIESSGTQYIDTGIIPLVANGSKVEFQFNLTDTSSGVYQSIGSNYNLNMYAVYNVLNFRSCAVNISQDLDTEIHTVILEYSDSGRLINFDGSSYVGETAEKLNSFYLFALNANDLGGVKIFYGKYQLRYCKMWDNGELVSDFVPCIRTSDNAVGMYDLVTDTFFENSGTGTFIAGPVVDEPSVHDIKKDYGTVTYDWYARNATTDNEWMLVGTTTTNSTTVTVSKEISTEFCVNASNIAGFDNTSETPVWFSAVHVPVVDEITVTPATVQAGSGSGVQTVNVTAEPSLVDLPGGYKRVEYVKSTGTQWIDTGIIPNDTTGFKLKLSVPNVTVDLFDFGCKNTEGSAADGFTLGTMNGVSYFRFGTVYMTSERISNDVPFTGYLNYMNERVCYVDGNSSKPLGDISGKTFDYPLIMFGRNVGGVIEGRPQNIYECEITQGTTLVRDFVPCIRISDNEVGMYDLVTNTFYNNSGTGSFTAGPEVSHYGTVNYEWFARNASTGNAWKSIGNTSTNTLNYSVSTTESTQFYANATNIAGSNESTKNNPGLFAIYTTLSLDTVGGDNTSQVVNATYGSSVLDKTVNASTKSGYTFRGWDVIASPKNLTVINETGVLVKGVEDYTDANGNWTNATGAITLYANWSSVYTIRYHANNGTTVNVTKTDIPYNKDVALNSSTELGFTPQEGLTFVNWTTYANGTGSSYADEAEVQNLAELDETADLYAVWQTNQTALNSSTKEVTIGGTTYTKWNASKQSPYVVGYDTLNGTAVFGPFVIESPGAGEKLNYTLTAQNLTEADKLGRIVVTYIDDGTVTPLDNTTGFTFEDHDGNGYLNLTESGRSKTGLSNVSVVVKEYPLGDANTNDLVDIVDSASVGVYILKGGGETVSPAADIFLPDENKVHGDVNHDGLVDVADMLKINQYLVGSSVLV